MARGAGVNGLARLARLADALQIAAIVVDVLAGVVSNGPGARRSRDVHSSGPVLRLRRRMMLAMSPARQRSPADPASEKRSLASILRDHGPLPVIDAVDIALDVCDELANAHVNGIVHGDLGLHRVRTHWPRVPKQRADIFALGENDSAAFAFRASAVSILVAPEQRAGAAVDTRADVWAVGAILHWLIAGASPSADPLEKSLARAPRTLVITVAACLAEDPGKRPQSVNEIAEALGSFASSPADRFEQLARRRALIENAKRVRTDLGDVDRVLGRLDDAALARELASAAAPLPSLVEPAIDRLALAVHESTGSLIFDDSGSVTDLDDDDASDAETVLAQPSLTELHAAERGEIVASPLAIAPVVLSSELLAPPKPPVAAAARPVAPVPPVAAPERAKRSTVALAIVGAALAVALGVGIGMHLVEGALARHDTAAADLASGAVSGAGTSAAGTSGAGTSVSGAGTSMSGAGASTSRAGAVSGAGTSGAGTSAGATLAVASPNGAPPAPSLGASPATEAPSVMSVTSLPDARPLTPSSLPDARPLTPSSLPDARPAAPRAALPARSDATPRASTPPGPPSATEGETVPAGFKSFDGTSP
ncbi:MAG: hypothetical protein KF894_03500 [Labilithrix sp.]|nr:hypothetical protein [Labilithrix sp.]